MLCGIKIKNLTPDRRETPANVYFILGEIVWNNDGKLKPNHGNHRSSIAMTNFPTASLEQCTEFDKILLTVTFIAALIAVYNVIIQSKLSNKVAKKED